MSHKTHCYQGEYKNSCKYGDLPLDPCPNRPVPNRDGELVDLMEPILDKYRFDEVLFAIADRAWFEADNSLDESIGKWYSKLAKKIEKCQDLAFHSVRFHEETRK